MEEDVSKSGCWFSSWCTPFSYQHPLSEACSCNALALLVRERMVWNRSCISLFLLPPSQFLFPGQKHLQSNHVLQRCWKIKIVFVVITVPLTSKLGFPHFCWIIPFEWPLNTCPCLTFSSVPHSMGQGQPFFDPFPRTAQATRSPVEYLQGVASVWVVSHLSPLYPAVFPPSLPAHSPSVSLT